MILENIADVIAGQIMTRVTEDNNDGEPVQVLAPKAISNGIIIKEDLGKAVLSKMLMKISIPRREMWL